MTNTLTDLLLLFRKSFRTSLTQAFSWTFMALLLLHSGLNAQSLPVSATYDPGEFGNGDEIAIDIAVGNEDQPAEEVLGLHIELEYEGFSIDEESELGLDCDASSWFGGDGNWVGDIQNSAENNLLIIDLFRTDGTAVSGHGFAVRSIGIIIVMDEIHGKAPLTLSQLKATPILAPAGLQPYLTLEGSATKLHWNVPAGQHTEGGSLLNLQGQVIRHIGAGAQSLEVGDLPAQIYLLRIQTEQGVLVKKVMLQ
ncbi:MAG: T9SS type A sorting domain-containing protein [Bacteroidota bacterium]